MPTQADLLAKGLESSLGTPGKAEMDRAVRNGWPWWFVLFWVKTVRDICATRKLGLHPGGRDSHLSPGNDRLTSFPDGRQAETLKRLEDKGRKIIAMAAATEAPEDFINAAPRASLAELAAFCGISKSAAARRFTSTKRTVRIDLQSSLRFLKKARKSAQGGMSEDERRLVREIRDESRAFWREGQEKALED